MTSCWALTDLQPEEGHETLYVTRKLTKKHVWFGGPPVSSSAPEVRRLIARARELIARARERVERLTERIGRERVVQRESAISDWEALPLVEKLAAPQGVKAPAVAGGGCDGGRMQRSDLPEDAKSHWCETKVGALLEIAANPHDADPCPQAPTKFLDVVRMEQVTREIKRAVPKGSGSAMGMVGTPQVEWKVASPVTACGGMFHLGQPRRPVVRGEHRPQFNQAQNLSIFGNCSGFRSAPIDCFNDIGTQPIVGRPSDIKTNAIRFEPRLGHVPVFAWCRTAERTSEAPPQYRRGVSCGKRNSADGCRLIGCQPLHDFFRGDLRLTTPRPTPSGSTRFHNANHSLQRPDIKLPGQRRNTVASRVDDRVLAGPQWAEK